MRMMLPIAVSNNNSAMKKALRMLVASGVLELLSI